MLNFHLANFDFYRPHTEQKRYLIFNALEMKKFSLTVAKVDIIVKVLKLLAFYVSINCHGCHYVSIAITQKNASENCRESTQQKDQNHFAFKWMLIIVHCTAIQKSSMTNKTQWIFTGPSKWLLCYLLWRKKYEFLFLLSTSFDEFVLTMLWNMWKFN